MDLRFVEDKLRNKKLLRGEAWDIAYFLWGSTVSIRKDRDTRMCEIVDAKDGDVVGSGSTWEEALREAQLRRAPNPKPVSPKKETKPRIKGDRWGHDGVGLGPCSPQCPGCEAERAFIEERTNENVENGH